MSSKLPSTPKQSLVQADGQGGDALVEFTPQGSGRRVEPDLQERPDYRRYLAALLRYKWLIPILLVAGGAAGIVGSRFIQPEYSAQATIWIETEPGTQGPIRAGQLLGGTGWSELLRSYVVLDKTVTDLKLYLEFDTPADSAVFASFALRERFRPGSYRLTVAEDGGSVALSTGDGIELERVAPGDSLGGEVGFDWVPPAPDLHPGKKFDFSVVRPREAARSLGERVKTRGSQNGSFLRVELSGTNPSLIAATTNALIERFVEVAAELKRARLTELAMILEEQLEQARRNLVEAEFALESYRVATITLPSETPVVAGLEMTQGPAFQGFFELKREQDQIAQDLAAIRLALGQTADSGFAVDAFEAIGAVQRSTEVTATLRELAQKQAELRALRYDHTEEHPAVQRLSEEVRQLENTSIPSLLEGVISGLAARQSVLDGRVLATSQELEQIPPRAIQEARLRRDVTVAENLYTTLQERYEGARLAEASSIPDVRILDRAVVPQRPVHDPRPRLVMMGLAAGLGIGLAGALLLDRIDRRVRYANQVTSELGLPLLGVVPHFDNKGNGSGADGAVPIIEALRGARLNLIHAHGTSGPLMVTVTSPGPREGKSFIASNLALAFAEAGHRTLLIDADVRRGALHQALNASRKPGLTDFLRGTASRAEIVQQTAYHSLLFVGAGTRVGHGPELLGGELMRELLTSQRSGSQNHVVIVDSPPLAAGVDALTLGTLTGTVLIVLRLGRSDRELTEAKLDIMDRLPIRVLGAILNDVGMGGPYHYHYPHRYYLQGYEVEDEPPQSEHPLLESSG